MRFADIKEDKEITKIVYNYFVNHYKNPQTAFDEIKKLNTKVRLTGNTKLIRFGDIVFLLRLHGDELEFHSIGHSSSTFQYIKELYALVDYAQQLKVRSISSYSNDKIFDTIFRRIKLNFTKDIKVAPDGITYNYYRLEF